MKYEKPEHLNILAIIPARGGSKGIPRKNLKLLGGKPLLVYTLEAALQSRVCDRVIVSTEDEEIAGVAKRQGAEVLVRPSELSGDEVSTEAVLEHSIATLAGEGNYRPDIIILLQATSPFRNSDHIKEALNEYLNNRYDSLLSVFPSHATLWHSGKTGAQPVNYSPMKQNKENDIPPEYQENGAIFITSYNVLMNEHNRLGGRIGLYIMPEEDSLEVDSFYDLWLCEQALAYKTR